MLNSKTLLWAAAVLLVSLAAIWIAFILMDGANRRAIVRRLPAQPDMNLESAKLKELVNQAETRVLSDDPGPAVGALGNLYLANFHYNEAAACYELAREIDPENPQWPYLLGYVKTMMGDSSSAMELFDDTLRLASAYVPARLRRADNLYKNGQLDDAKADYERCLTLEPANAYAHLGLARIAISREEWDAAEASLRNAIEADPSFGVAHRLMASVHEHFSRIEERDRELQIAEACGRFFPAPDPWLDDLEKLCFHSGKLLAKGYMAEKVGKFNVARTAYERVIEIEPDSFDANFRLATVLQTQDEREKAKTLFEKALQLETSDPSRYPVIYSNLGEIYYRNGAIDKAVESLRKAIELDPGFVAAYLSLGAALTQQGRASEAIEHCAKALELDPNSDTAHYNWGVALLKLGMPDEAVVHFERATQLNPDLAVAYYQIGTYYLRNRDAVSGRQYMQRALDAAERIGNSGLAATIRKAMG